MHVQSRFVFVFVVVVVVVVIVFCHSLDLLSIYYLLILFFNSRCRRHAP